MTHLSAISGQPVKPEIRYLRGALFDGPCYLSAMQLRIKELRKDRGWTVQQLADRVSLSKSYVSDIENGKRRPNKDRLGQFAAAFQVSIYELLDDGSLNPDERELLLDFSEMSPENRAILLQTARLFRERSGEAEAGGS